MIKAKTFIHALNLCLTDVKKAKSYMKDMRLTQVEKTILESYFLLRDNNLSEVISVLEKISSPDPIVESQRKFLLGAAYNNMTKYEIAIPYLKDAYKLLSKSELVHQQFVALNNLFITYLNLRDKKNMALVLDQMSEIDLTWEVQKISYQRCILNFNVVSKNYHEAHDVLTKLNKLIPKMSEAQVISFLIDKFKFYIAQKDFSNCESTLNEMKNYRKFHLSANYNFMKNLLNHLTDNKPLWITDSDYQEMPLLFHQIKCIQKLEQHNEVEAKSHWQELMKIDGQNCEENFKYVGDECLFSMCLGKYTSDKKVFIKPSVVEGESKEEIFINYLNSCHGTASKEVMYKVIYGTELLDKSETAKLHKLVSRIRQKYHIEIEFRQGCYHLSHKKKSA